MQATASAPPARPGWAYAAMGLVALVTLDAELLFTRIISVLAYYHLAFFIISLAVLGMTAGALATYVWQRHFDARTALPAYSLYFFLSIPLAVGCNFAIIQTEQGSLTAILGLALAAAVTSVPFILSGILISLTLTRCGLPYGRIYGADLLGAAAGCLLFVPALNQISAGGLALCLSAVGAVAALCYHRTFDLPLPRLGMLWPVVMGLLLAFSENRPTGLVPLAAKGQMIDPAEYQFMRWNSHSLVMVKNTGSYQAFLWGTGPHAPQINHDVAMLTIDGGAATPFLRFDGDLNKIRWLNHDVTTLAYQMQRPRSVAIIGLGGGRDVFSAMINGAEQVVGIDVNPLVVKLHNDELRALSRLPDQPGVSLVSDEARSYLTRCPERFDVIQMSLVDTWAASAAGAYTLTENGLYTQEAWDAFIEHLSERGIFTASRWYVDGVDESPRLVSLATMACLRQGLNPPSDHIAVAHSGQIATLVISRQPIQGALRDALGAACHRYQFDLLLAPGEASPVPFLQQLVDCRSQDELVSLTNQETLDIRAPDDDRPYFFNQLRFWRPDDIFSGVRAGTASANRRAALMVLVLLAISLGGMTLGIFWPLRRTGLPSGFPLPIFRLGLVYFAAIGLGFMLIEMAFVQRFSTLLGHPSYALTCVIGSMVLATGLGSLLSERLPTDRPATFRIYPLAVLVVQLAAWLALPWAVGVATTASLPVRIAVVLAFTLPCGLVMGLCLPLGMVQVTRYGTSIAPWLWGINGAASVLGTIMAILLSISLGISATFLVGIGCYALIVAVNLLLARKVSAGESIREAAASFKRLAAQPSGQKE
jgi:predicted membrane-bound spermidine synthase